MTCVVSTTPFNHFNDHFPWLSMNPDTASSHGSLEKSHSQGYVSPGSETRKSSTSSGSKKRASRAGTRSVSTLSAAQLERKRANDREAQRAIRQRTKDHIDHLERSINELRGSQEGNEKMVHVTQQRNRELEEENAYLRGKLNEAGFSINLLPTEHHRNTDSALLSVPAASPVTAAGSSIPRPGSTSTHSNHSMAAQPTGSRHGSWQHQTAGFVGAPNTTIGVLPGGAAAAANAPNLPTWRSHENAPTLQDPMQPQSSATYNPDQRVEWSSTGASYQPYVTQEQQRPQYETAPSQPSGYSSSSVPTYPGQMAGQSEYPNISVSSSPGSYQVQGQTAFPPPASFQVSPMQVPTSGTGYTSPHGQMQPPPLPNPSFHSGHGESAAYGSQPTASMQYRDDNANRSYSLTHYPTA